MPVVPSQRSQAQQGLPLKRLNLSSDRTATERGLESGKARSLQIFFSISKLSNTFKMSELRGSTCNLHHEILTWSCPNSGCVVDPFTRNIVLLNVQQAALTDLTIYSCTPGVHV